MLDYDSSYPHAISGYNGIRIVNPSIFETFKTTLSTPSFWYSIGAFVIFTALALAIRKKSDV